MDEGEVELNSRNFLLEKPDSSLSFQNSASIDSLLDEFLKNTRTCTHTHTCNPPGPDETHTHTCYHTHTRVIAPEGDECANGEGHLSLKPRRPLGNREAVRKYREKKKAHAAYLEEEVQKLRSMNQHLFRKLEGQAILKAEVLRLRSLLVDMRAKIDGELGVFPLQKQFNTCDTPAESDCGLYSSGGAINQHCPTDLPCLHPQTGSLSQASINMIGSWEGNCQPATANCQANINGIANHDGRTLDTVNTSVLSLSLSETG